MDERGFREFLKGKKQATVRTYVYSVAQFEKWLFDERQQKSLENANERDISNWAPNARGPNYLHGIKQYYRYKRNPEMVKEIDRILKKLPKFRPTPRLFDWIDFRNEMSRAERKCINHRDRALLNLLWSEIPSKGILELYFSDIDFEKLLITHYSGEKYYITKEAWDALQKYVSIGDRGKKKRLFPIKSERALQKITEVYFSGVKQTPKTLHDNCQKDLVNAGRRARFIIIGPEQISSPKIQLEQKEERIEKNLFDKLVQEIKDFGNKMHERIGRIKDEKEFKRLLEGYFLATLSDEIIAPEFYFRGDGQADSIIDFAIGRDQKIPIEVKITEKKIRDDIGKGSGQVKEFLKSCGSNKGILVIVDKERDPERQKHSGMQDSVYIIVI
jgi:site-specific recombinase XerD